MLKPDRSGSNATLISDDDIAAASFDLMLEVLSAIQDGQHHPNARGAACQTQPQAREQTLRQETGGAAAYPSWHRWPPPRLTR